VPLLVKNKLALNLLFTANGISGFAQGISMLAIPWYFTRIHANSYFNIAYGIITIAVLFFGLYAGTLVDRFSRKSNFLGNSLVCGILLLAISCIGFFQQSLSEFLVVAVFGITMLNYNIHYPTLYAFGQEISNPEDYAKVNASIEVVGQSTSIVSGGIAAVMLEGGSFSFGGVGIGFQAWTIWEIFLLNAITYFIAAGLIALIRYTPAPLKHVETSVYRRIKTGFSYLKAHPVLLIFGLFSYSVFAMLLVEVHAVLPAYVDKHLHEKGSVFAIADGIYAIGALSAGLFVNKVFNSGRTQQAVIILTWITAGIFIWAFASTSVLVIYLVNLILGFTNAGIRVLRLTHLFNNVPNELMGRVNSIFNMVNLLVRTLFIFLFSIPFFNFDNNVIWTYLIMGLFLVASAIVLIFNRKQHINKLT
jgi:MFS transporter, DHA3 family, macrolide efflux protein